MQQSQLCEAVGLADGSCVDQQLGHILAIGGEAAGGRRRKEGKGGGG